MDYTKWYNKYCLDCDLKYQSVNTRTNYKSCVSLFLNKFKMVNQPQRISNDDIKKWLLEANTTNTIKHRLCAVNYSPTAEPMGWSSEVNTPTKVYLVGSSFRVLVSVPDTGCLLHL